MHIYIYIYIYTHTHTHNMHIYTYIYVYMCRIGTPSYYNEFLKREGIEEMRDGGHM